MWNKDKSVLLTQAIVRICYVLLAAAVIILPFLLKRYESDNSMNMISHFGKYALGPFYAIAPAGYVALICIDRLLINIKKEIVFDIKNVKLLRIISLSCFYASIICIIAFAIVCITFNYGIGLGLILLAAGAGFMGLVVRVVKNIFEAAIEIKEENELTI